MVLHVPAKLGDPRRVVLSKLGVKLDLSVGEHERELGVVVGQDLEGEEE